MNILAPTKRILQGCFVFKHSSFNRVHRIDLRELEASRGAMSMESASPFSSRGQATCPCGGFPLASDSP